MKIKKKVDIAFSKKLEFKDLIFSIGLNVFNLFDIRNVRDVWPETGEPERRSEYFTKDIGLPENRGKISNSYYDMPWRYSEPRKIDFSIKIEYR